MKPLPMAPSCALDEGESRLQYERYRAAGRGAQVLERSPRRLVIRLDDAVHRTLVAQAVDVERACCPFFGIDWQPELMRLTVSVADAAHEPALEAIAFALDLPAQTG